MDNQSESSDGQWVVAQGVIDDQIVLVRLRTDAPQIGRSRGFTERIGIAIPFNTPGTPSSSEQSAVERIEDHLFERLRYGNVGILAVVVTTEEMREYVMYVHDGRFEQSLVDELKASHPHLEIGSYLEPDPEWSAFKFFGSLCEG